jgi:hypothetical protein
MPTTQKLQQKQTKATQKVGGSAKKPVTKAMEGGKGNVASVKSKAATRGGVSAKGLMPWNKKSTENANDIIELKGNISNIRGDISNIRGDISNIRDDIIKLKSGLKVKEFYIDAILGKYDEAEVIEIIQKVTQQIEKNNTQMKNKS